METEKMKVGLKADKHKDKRDKEQESKIWKGKQSHFDSKNRVHFQVAYFVIFVSHLDSYLQYVDKAYLSPSTPREQTEGRDKKNSSGTLLSNICLPQESVSIHSITLSFENTLQPSLQVTQHIL